MVWFYCDHCGDSIKKVNIYCFCDVYTVDSVWPTPATAGAAGSSRGRMPTPHAPACPAQPKLANHFSSCRAQTVTCVDCSRSFDRSTASVSSGAPQQSVRHSIIPDAAMRSGWF